MSLEKIKEVQDLINKKEIEHNLAKKKIFKSKVEMKLNKRKLINLEKLKGIVIEISKQSQEKIINHLENIVNHALKTIYEDELNFKIELEQKRDQQEIHFYIKTKNGELLEPRKDQCSAGSIDIMSLGLKMGVFPLEKNVDPIIFWDEPMKNLGIYTELGALVLKEISKSLNLQSFLITHDERLIDIADKVFKIGD